LGGGRRWLVLGNLVHSTVTGDLILFGWLGPSGRPPTPHEMMTTRAPYTAGGARRERERQELPDDLLADQAAIEAAYAEQRREPVNLISRAA
jgi:hypothetical protein